MDLVALGLHRRSHLTVKQLHDRGAAGGRLLESELVLRTTDDEPDAIFEFDAPSPRWSILEKVRIRSDLPAVIDGRRLVAGPFLLDSLRSPGEPLVKNAILRGGPNRVSVRRTGRTYALEEGIFLGGFAPRAYFHHLCERISRLALLDLLPPDLQGLPILVPEEILSVESLVEATRLLAPSHELVPLRWEDEYLVGRLVWIDEIHRWTAAHPQVMTHVEAMRRFRQKILHRLQIAPRIEPGLRLFIDRGARRRSPAAHDLRKLALDCGFESWTPETLPFAEQVGLWSRAEFVAGESGAAWSGSLFAPVGSKGLIVTGGEASGWPHLGRISGMRINLLRSYDPDGFTRELADRSGQAHGTH